MLKTVSCLFSFFLKKKTGNNIFNHYKQHDMAQNSKIISTSNKNVNHAGRIKVFSEEIMVKCDVSCGADEKQVWCDFPPSLHLQFEKLYGFENQSLRRMFNFCIVIKI